MDLGLYIWSMEIKIEFESVTLVANATVLGKKYKVEIATISYSEFQSLFCFDDSELVSPKPKKSKFQQRMEEEMSKKGGKNYDKLFNKIR